ncbi:MAG: helix-turn-helix domain-containing protein [Mycobacterium sp.]|uniref:helix-turn-helix domain-containing protein n=1 Tax=Mycobacterium sp. TaxID=1785 RepID=UPI003C36F3A5
MDELQATDELEGGQVDLSVDNALLYTRYRRLAAEQAALRRLATLVARGVEPAEVFDAVVKEMRRCLLTERAGLWRYETSGEITLLAVDHRSPAPVKWPVGTRTPIDGSTLAAIVQRTGRPARMDSYQNSAGRVAECVRAVGVRAAVGVPVTVDGRVWGLAAVGSVEPGPMPPDTEARISGFAELIGTALVAGYRDEQKRQMLDDTSRRSSLIDSLLEGRVVDDCSLWEVAGHLRLPKDGPFVVIGAEVRSRGSEALPVIESKLRSIDVYSAWRLLPDWQVGIVHVASEQQFDKVVALVSRAAVDRVGVSARFDDLRATPQALHFAKMTLLGRLNDGSPVAVFDGTILATAALAAPEVMVKSASTALAAFGDLPEEEREVLFETFRVWQETDASVGAAAELLCCHPNTVRYRLRRIEKRTGRSLSRPRDVAELCLAFEVHRRLI